MLGLVLQNSFECFDRLIHEIELIEQDIREFEPYFKRSVKFTFIDGFLKLHR